MTGNGWIQVGNDRKMYPVDNRYGFVPAQEEEHEQKK